MPLCIIYYNIKDKKNLDPTQGEWMSMSTQEPEDFPSSYKLLLKSCQAFDFVNERVECEGGNG